jgi:hypothetical protein
LLKICDFIEPVHRYIFIHEKLVSALQLYNLLPQRFSQQGSM